MSPQLFPNDALPIIIQRLLSALVEGDVDAVEVRVHLLVVVAQHVEPAAQRGILVVDGHDLRRCLTSRTFSGM